MKTNHLLSLIVIAGLATLLPGPVFAAKDKDKDEEKVQTKQDKPWSEAEKQDKPSSKGKKRVSRPSEKPEGTNVVTRRNTTTQPYQTTSVPRTATADRTQNSNERNRQQDSDRNSPSGRNWSDNRTADSEGSRRQSGANRSSSTNRQYNRSNQYGGLWFSADTHRSWERNRRYSWNNHQYRWYDGGWLIIDAGFTPDYYTSSDSIEVQVQIELADQGYYRGPIDGDVGYGTRRAIARYQDDNGLRVTGGINHSLLLALGL
jgi:hypothetical protein